jgi:dienelactone hydrolase
MPMHKRLASVLLVLCAAAALPAAAQADSWMAALGDARESLPELREEVIHIPLADATADEQKFPLTGSLYQPRGGGPFPVVVLNHGSPLRARDRAQMGRYRLVAQTRALVGRGYAVLVPMRRGYGASPGDMVEGSGACDRPRYAQSGAESARDVRSAIEFVRTRPSLDDTRIVLMGQSAGGFAALAAASQAPRGVVAVVNLSGGRGGNGRDGIPCRADAMRELIAQYARTIAVPVLWHYVENDKYFGPQGVRSWFEAFEAAGAKGRLVLQAPYGNDGHLLFYSPAAIPIWSGAMAQFFRDFGLGQLP